MLDLNRNMRRTRVAASYLLIIVGLIFLLSSVSAFWPFDNLLAKRTVTGNAISYSSNYPLCIGYELGETGCAHGHSFNGYLDEVRVYNRALTTDEVAASAYLNYPEQGLVAYWNFDSASSTSVQDRSGNGMVASLNNGAQVIIDPAGSALDNVLSLDGTDDFASIPYSASLQPANELSFGAWMKSNNYAQSQRIISAVQSGGYGLVMNDPYGTCRNNTLCAIVRVGNSYLTAEQNISQLPSPGYGGWYNVFATFNGTTVKLFVQGRQVAPPLPTNTTVQRGGECDARSGLQHTRVCSSSLTCQDTNGDGIGACRSPAGQACSNTNECLSGYGLTCVNSVCTLSNSTITVGLGQECNMREVPNKKICSSDATCQDTNDDGIGACRHAAGLGCSQDSDCLSGVASLRCIQGICSSQNASGNSSAASPQITCNDSDGGQNYYVAGTAAGIEWAQTFAVQSADHCETQGEKSGRLIEFYCERNQVTSISVACKLGCSNGACASESQGHISDISVRGYTDVGLKTLVLGFYPRFSGEILATIIDSWTSATKIDASVVTATLLTSSGVVEDYDENPQNLHADVYERDGAYGLAATAEGKGSVVLATYNSTLAFKQFSGRAFIDDENPLILGFAVNGGELNLDIQANPQKLPAEFVPRLDRLEYTVNLYRGSQLLRTSQSTINTQLAPGNYTVVIEANGSASGYMLLEIMDVNAYAPAAAAQIQANASETIVVGSNASAREGSASESSETVRCDSGCLSASGRNCYENGFRTSDSFCDGTVNTLVQQKSSGMACNNGFECESNICAANQCIDVGLFQRILAWFRATF